MGVTDVFSQLWLKYIPRKLSAIMKRHCCHSNHGSQTNLLHNDIHGYLKQAFAVLLYMK